MLTKQPARILIRSANWVGDAIMSIPAIHAVHRGFPHAEITILAKPWVAPVYDHCPYVDRVILYEEKEKHNGLTGILRLCRELRNHHFDAAISIQNAFEAGLIMWLSGIPVRIGYAADGRSALLTHRVYRTPAIRTTHQIDYYLSLVAGVGIVPCGRNLELFLSDTERQCARQLLQETGFKPDLQIIGINPGAAFGTAKRWFPERFIEVCNRLNKKGDRRFLVFGSPAEAGLGETIRQGIGDSCINLCGKTFLREAFALIDRCSLFITNDSGLMHAAAAQNVPQIAIFGPTRLNTMPLNDNSHILRVPVSCGPCMKPHCQTDHRCMDAVTVDMVANLASRLLS
ncbi:MAG: lipopolysaccharide heptosyltransferase II [Desulfatirhabdiaceae bacterium]